MYIGIRHFLRIINQIVLNFSYRVFITWNHVIGPISPWSSEIIWSGSQTFDTRFWPHFSGSINGLLSSLTDRGGTSACTAANINRNHALYLYTNWTRNSLENIAGGISRLTFKVQTANIYLIFYKFFASVFLLHLHSSLTILNRFTHGL